MAIRDLFSRSAPSVGAGEGLEADELSYLFADAVSTVADEELIDLSGPVPVRAALASKLGRMLPGLNAERRERVFELTCTALERLARDEAVLVREALATAIKDVACAPPAVCLQLARDVEAVVAEPILRCCAGLKDSDLLTILRGKPPPWAVAAIAGRPRVPAEVSVAVYEAGDSEATGVLLDNHGAEIPEETLGEIVDEARHRPDWQNKLVHRPVLPRRLAVKLAGFVDQAALEFLRHREDIDAATAREIVKVTRRRIEWLSDTRPDETAEARVKRLFRKGDLDEAALEDALSWKQLDFVRAALAVRARVPLAIIDKILQAHSGRAVTALAWSAELSMRTAFMLQRDLAKVPRSQLIYPRDGASYPMTADEMTWQLEFFGVPGAH
ncbi:MAG: DUF2336 domain-containing protein [Rhodospirillaceae bacterium]